MRIGSFLSLRVSLNPGCTSSSCVGWRTYRETLLLPTFLLHLVTAINILSLGTASLCFPDSGDTPPAPSPSCTMTPQPCMLLASGILEFIYHVSMGKDLRATLRSLRAAQLGAHSVFSLSGLILAPTAQDPQPGEPPLSALLLPLPMIEAPRATARDVPDKLPPPGCSGGSCYPPTSNLIIGCGQNLRTSSTCGLHGPELYCIVSNLQDAENCFFCDSRDWKSHGIENVISQSSPGSKRTWWRAERGVENVTSWT
ncbi:uncharacterized protein [Sagmatias obliquidens]|uniref:uncharacterized protein isoform X2 n=1 Tax=Sagmatias obliquidens TaxID=3371155 RepID=UPI000F442AA7|nr:uncharacterized protein LOC113615849 isoform X2 [Lagenorhynchus obliquidens]